MEISVATDQEWHIIRYSAGDKERWDRFVRRSKNGTFLMQRDYMDYHADRFQDCSLMIFCNRKLTALLPGNLSGSCFYSHQGLTYGGMLLSPSITLQQVESVFHAALDYLQKKTFMSSPGWVQPLWHGASHPSFHWTTVCLSVLSAVAN